MQIRLPAFLAVALAATGKATHLTLSGGLVGNWLEVMDRRGEQPHRGCRNRNRRRRGKWKGWMQQQREAGRR